MKSVLGVVICFSLALAGCVSNPPQSSQVEKSNLTAGQVSLTLKKDITTQAEVVEKFGAPNLVTQNSAGEEVWTYQKHASVSSSTSNSAYANIIIFGARSGSSGFEQSSRTMTLIIKFKDNNGLKVVSDFSSRYSSF